MRHLEIIESEIQRLDRVVQTLVDFSRPVELQLKEQDLRRIVSGVLMLASAELETHNVRVSSHMPDRPMIAKVDADLIKQAILNVVLNGAQAMAQGGELHVTLREEGRMAAIEIADSGSGIPDDIRAKIFDLYFTTRKDGSGIGLAMTYRIIQLHNGSIDVQSEQNIGSTFTLKLPLLASAEGKLRGSQLDKDNIGSGLHLRRVRPMTRRFLSLHIHGRNAAHSRRYQDAPTFTKNTPPPVPLIAQAPSLMPPPLAPLYSELSQNDPALPELPAPPAPGAQPTPPPASIIADTTEKPCVTQPSPRTQGSKSK